MSGAERRASLSLTGIFSLRMLGLFMIRPCLLSARTSSRGVDSFRAI